MVKVDLSRISNSDEILRPIKNWKILVEEGGEEYTEEEFFEEHQCNA